MQLYSVTFETIEVVSKFDSKGKKISEFKTPIKQTLHDLPASTAHAYADKTQNCVITKQEFRVSSKSDGKSRHNVRFADQKVGKSRRPEPTKLDAPNRSAHPKQSINQAAATGDMAAAINART